ncbi:MAG TPA: branched-chain amino acid ABC transporter permease [Herpetosiphonaceae bacterium]
MSNRAMQRSLLGAALIFVLALPQLVYPILALDILLWGLFALALNLLLGYGGLLSFGHAAFWGSAAYAAGIAAKQWGLPFPLAALSGMVVAVLLALPIGYLSIRRTGIYFSMVTLAFAQMIFYIVNQWRGVTGGENGLQGIPRTLWGLNLSDPTIFYYAVLPLVLLGFWLTFRVVHSPFGHVLVAIRDNEARARALGYPTDRYKLIVFLISAGLSGLAGGLFALGHGFTALEVVHWTTSGTVVMMTILGGIGTLWGGIVGAALVLLLRDWLSNWTDAWGVITGAIFVLVVLSFRRGIWGTLLQRTAGREQRS